MDIESILRGGESQTVEFKQSLAEMKEACKALCGMLNTDAGHGAVLFGISPGNDVVGLKGNLDSSQQTLAQHIQQKFEPSIVSSIAIQQHKDANILILSAKRHSDVAYHEYDGRAFIKEGSTKRLLSYDEKQVFLSKTNRANHNGPWKCDKCGANVVMLVSATMTDQGLQKTYDCGCGGEYWPAT